METLKRLGDWTVILQGDSCTLCLKGETIMRARYMTPFDIDLLIDCFNMAVS